MNLAEATQAREIPRPSIARAAEVSGAELAAMLDLLPRLTEDQWQLPTSCAGWTVRDVVSHVVGAYEEAPRPWLMFRRIRQARRDTPELGALDGHNHRQVADRRAVPGQQLVDLLGRFGPKGIRALRRMPAPVRRVRLSRVFPEAVDQPEDSLDFLVRVLAVRDVWMHRVDVADAAGLPVVLGEHDREVVAQLVRDVATEWAGPGVLLELTGAAGGRWLVGSESPQGTLRCEAVDYLRLVSGRAALTEPVVEGESDAATRLAAVRIPF